jgi:hypothetical protein
MKGIKSEVQISALWRRNFNILFFVIVKETILQKLATLSSFSSHFRYLEVKIEI